MLFCAAEPSAERALCWLCAELISVLTLCLGSSAEVEPLSELCACSACDTGHYVTVRTTGSVRALFGAVSNDMEELSMRTDVAKCRRELLCVQTANKVG